MIFTFLLGVAAGVLVPIAEPRVRAAMESIAMRKIEIKDTEFDILTLLLLMLVAAFLAAVFGATGMAFPMVLGAMLGLFHKPILAAIKGDKGEDA